MQMLLVRGGFMGSKTCDPCVRSLCVREVLHNIEQPALRYGLSAKLAQALLLPSDEPASERYDTSTIGL